MLQLANKISIVHDSTLLDSFIGVISQLQLAIQQKTTYSVHGILLVKIYYCRRNEFLKSVNQAYVIKQKKCGCLYRVKRQTKDICI